MIQPLKNHLKKQNIQVFFRPSFDILTFNPQGGTRSKCPVVFLEFPPIPRPWPGSIAATGPIANNWTNFHMFFVDSPLSNWYFLTKERQISISFGVDYLNISTLRQAFLLQSNTPVNPCGSDFFHAWTGWDGTEIILRFSWKSTPSVGCGCVTQILWEQRWKFQICPNISMS